MEDKELPAGWCSVKLSDVATHHSGNSKLIKGKLSSKREARMHPAYSATGQDVWREAFEQEGSAIIISAVGARCGKCFKADGKWSAIANTQIVWPIEEVADRDFLWFKLNNERFWVRGGSAQPFVKTKESFKHEFGLPPLAEQQRIVEKIETLFAELDKGEEALREVQKLLARYRQAVLKAAVTGALTADWRDANGSPDETGQDLLNRILEERRTTWQGRGKYKEPVKPNIEGLPELPSGWVWTSAGYICESIVPNRDKPKSFSGDIPWITIPDLDDVGYRVTKSRQGIGLSQQEVSENRARVVPEGSVVMTCVGRFGISAVCEQDLVINQQLHAFVPPPGMVDATFLAFCLQAQKAYMDQTATSTTIAYLNKTNCNNTPIPLPPFDEQKAVAALIEDKLSQISVAESWCETELKRSAALRQSILKDAFSGMLVRQDPSDEPADKLLERIRAARDDKPKAKRKKATA